MTTFLPITPTNARWTLLLAHGAGAAMDSPFLNTLSAMLAEQGVATLRFEFAYMAARRQGGKKRPPPKAEVLMPEYLAAVAEARTLVGAAPLLIGGKSMGGRVASMSAERLWVQQRIAGLVCLGYPFHAPNTPDKLRTVQLINLTCPTLVVQGTRDPFGSKVEIDALTLSSAIDFHWADDGDHDLGPRGASGFTRKGNLATAAQRIAAFAAKQTADA